MTSIMFIGNSVRNSVETAVEERVRKAIAACAERYAFDAKEAYAFAMKQPDTNENTLWDTFTVELLSTPVGKDRIKDKKPKKQINQEERNKKNKTFPLPYNGSICEDACYGIRNNNGLMTQCTAVKIADGLYCKDCSKQADKNENRLPDYGTIQLRNQVPIMDYIAPNGKSPVSYMKFIQKNNLTIQQVQDEALKLGITLDDVHFVEPDATTKKGRPKKEKKVIALNQSTDDLFATLIQEANAEEVSKQQNDNYDDVSSLSSVDSNNSKNKLTDEKLKAKELEKAEKLKAKELEKAEKEKAKELEKAEKEKAKELEKAEKLKAKELEKAEKLKAKELEKAEKLKAKELEKAEKPKIDKAEKSKIVKAEKPKIVKAEKPKIDKAELVNDTDEEDEPIQVRKTLINGKYYLKDSNTGEIYDMDQNLIGIWNNDTNKIDEYADDDEEEEEEEYEIENGNA